MPNRSGKRHANTTKTIDDLPDGITPEAYSMQTGRNTIARVNEHGLTDKQEGFARDVAKGSTLADAYRANYSTENSSISTVWSSASRLIDHPLVASRVKDLLHERATKTHAMDAMRIRQHVFDRLMLESVDEDNPPAARIRSLELLGKIDVVSMFKELKGKDREEDDDPIELQAKLKAMLERMVDITPKG